MSSRDYFARALLKSYDRFREQFQRFIFNLTTDPEQRIAAAQKLNEAIEALEDLLPIPEDRPPWMIQLKERLLGFILEGKTNPHKALHLQEFCQSNYWQMLNTDWGDVERGEAASFNISQLLEEVYSTSKAPALFAKLIELLEQLITDGQIETVSAEKSLKSLISLLKKNRLKPFSAWFSLKTVKTFVWNYLEVMSKDEKASPYLRPITEAIKETVKEIDSDMDGVMTETQHKIDERLTATPLLLEGNEFRPLGLPTPKPDPHCEPARIAYRVDDSLPVAEKDEESDELNDSNATG